jgi:hypothetical protein
MKSGHMAQIVQHVVSKTGVEEEQHVVSKAGVEAPPTAGTPPASDFG